MMEDLDDDAPPLLVMQIKAHWEKYRPRTVAGLKAAGVYEACVRQAAIMTSDAVYDLMTKYGLPYHEAWNLISGEWAFVPGEDEDPGGEA